MNPKTFYEIGEALLAILLVFLGIALFTAWLSDRTPAVDVQKNVPPPA